MDIFLEKLREEALKGGAFRAEIVRVAEISRDASFRGLCEANACGNFGMNYMCPPDIGRIEELMEALSSYEKAMVYQTVTRLEDSYDFEGMMAAGDIHNRLAQRLRAWAENGRGQETEVLHLGAGGCRVCAVCGKRTGEPCRFPDKALGSLEAYGVNVSRLAETAGMKYINGQNTVTYFGAVFCRGKGADSDRAIRKPRPGRRSFGRREITAEAGRGIKRRIPPKPGGGIRKRIPPKPDRSIEKRDPPEPVGDIRKRNVRQRRAWGYRDEQKYETMAGGAAESGKEESAAHPVLSGSAADGNQRAGADFGQ